MNFAPKSIAGLMVLGLCVVVLPSLIANARALFVVDSLSTQSQTLVSLGVEMMRDTATVKDELVELERSARQFQILREPDLITQISQVSSGLTNRLEFMATMAGDSKPAEEFTGLAVEIKQLTSRFVEGMPEEHLITNIDNLQTLRELANQATENGQQLVNRRMEELRLAASSARSSVIWQALTVIPGTLVLMLLITYLVSRPVQRIINAIRDLGHGVFDRRIRISGPAELASLGNELNWLGRRLSEADEEKHNFLKSMSHDLKTPVASIREGTELLHDQLIGELNSEQLEVSGIIRDSSILLQSQIENLLNFKLSDALDESEPERFKLNELVRALRAQHHLALTQKQINLLVDGGSLWITGYREKLRIALDNLVSNAVKIAPSNSTIKMLARKDNQQIIIDVIDQGPGVAEADRELIFRPFFQGQTPQAGQIKGTGLGLSVAKDCVKAHGGTLDLMPASASRKQGAHFRITLPDTPMGEPANDQSLSHKSDATSPSPARALELSSKTADHRLPADTTNPMTNISDANGGLYPTPLDGNASAGSVFSNPSDVVASVTNERRSVAGMDQSADPSKAHSKNTGLDTHESNATTVDASDLNRPIKHVVNS